MSDIQRIVYGTETSGHVHRVCLLLEMLGLPYRFEKAPADVRRTPEFLAMNPLGQIPVLDDEGLMIPDSNAILVYLALSYDASRTWLPSDPIEVAHVQRWLSIAAGELRFGPAMARAVSQFGAPGDPAQAKAIALRLLGFMERHLKFREWLAVSHPTIADLANYSYVAHAPEGGIGLEEYPSIRAWLARVEALPKFRPMPSLPYPKP